MKKDRFLYIFLLQILLFVALMNAPVVNASISYANWIGATYRGSDTFLGQSVIAYKTGSEAKLLVNVFSDYYVGYPYYSHRPVNISAVKVWADWNINYTSTEASFDSPIVVQLDQYHAFMITFTVPNTTIASNLVAHNYRIYVEQVNSTTGTKKIVNTWIYSGSGLAVYSAEQADSMEVLQKYSGMTMPSFVYPEARVLWITAMLEGGNGAKSYGMGNFADAQQHYKAMDDSIQQALQKEATKGAAVTDATIVEANATMMQSYGYILLGLGIALFGVGAIIYGIKKKPS